jgi:hypothetical protein
MSHLLTLSSTLALSTIACGARVEMSQPVPTGNATFNATGGAQGNCPSATDVTVAGPSTGPTAPGDPTAGDLASAGLSPITTDDIAILRNGACASDDFSALPADGGDQSCSYGVPQGSDPSCWGFCETIYVVFTAANGQPYMTWAYLYGGIATDSDCACGGIQFARDRFVAALCPTTCQAIAQLQATRSQLFVWSNPCAIIQ